MNDNRYNGSNEPIFLNIIVYGLLTILITVLQTTLMPRLTLFGVFPDLVITAVCCVAIYRGENTAAIFGLAAGLVVEAVGSVGVSLAPLFYVFVGYICGRVGANARNNTLFFAYLIALPFVCLSRTALTFINLHIGYWGSIEYGKMFLNILLPEFLYTLLAAFPVFAVVKLFELPIPNKRKRGTMY